MSLESSPYLPVNVSFLSKTGVSMVTAPCFLKTFVITLNTFSRTAICSGWRSRVPLGIFGFLLKSLVDTASKAAAAKSSSRGDRKSFTTTPSSFLSLLARRAFLNMAVPLPSPSGSDTLTAPSFSFFFFSFFFFPSPLPLSAAFASISFLFCSRSSSFLFTSASTSFIVATPNSTSTASTDIAAVTHFSKVFAARITLPSPPASLGRTSLDTASPTNPCS
mmetsp:Transcript_43604/g.113583  ORF Transcript_43604/g.113583 Transcript_43604/m.113583 type:complete len:220 (+) Transcript_43604:2024-2683(+)